MRDDLRGGAGPKLATYGQLKGPAQIFQKKILRYGPIAMLR
jgi:hypothetical protein